MYRPRAWAKPAANAGGLAEIAAEADDAHPRIFRLQLGEQLERIVRASVVNGQEFVRSPEASEGAVSSR